MSRLSSVEAHRYIAIMQETVERLTFLSCITPDVLAHRDELSQTVGDEITRIINEQRSLEEEYEVLVSRRFDLKRYPNKAEYKENQQAIQEVSRALRESTKTLCKNLKENPNISGNLLKIQSERTALSDLMLTTIKELRKSSYQTLANTVNADRREQENLEEIIAKEKATAAAVMRFEADLKAEKLEKETETKHRVTEISQLKAELHEIKSTTLHFAKFARKEAKAKLASTLRQYDSNEQHLRDKLEQLVRTKEKEDLVHSETVAFLTRKRDALLKEAEAWKGKLDVDKASAEEQLTAATEARERDLELLNKLKSRRENDVAEEEARLAAIAHQKELTRLAKIKECRQKSAVKKIENAMLGYKTKKAETAKKGKKGKGKKGKGKKKK